MSRQQIKQKKSRSKMGRQVDDLSRQALRLESALHNEFARMQRQAERDNRAIYTELNEEL